MEIHNKFKPQYTLPSPSPSSPSSPSSTSNNLSLPQLTNLKKEIITHLTNLTSQLPTNVTMQTPLLDNQGYPRSDFDVLSVRLIRCEIVKARNDLVSVDTLIELGLRREFEELKKHDSGGGGKDVDLKKLQIDDGVGVDGGVDGRGVGELKLNNNMNKKRGLKPILSIHSIQSSESPAYKANLKENDLVYSMTTKTHSCR
ncbi:unnamed protein product [Ambrosiozyma monospora]|uniref:Unnamed protein product n=1 Tax=Ambrosiozyma monospora TaxID=43982 RepID=A0A9W6WHX9_AMBMO|nr:unnamed protein product [Ambrosiozyma monospora]